MSPRYLIRALVIAHLIIAWALLWPILVWAEPAAQEGCPGNALRNPGFEDGFSERGAGEVSVANGWYPWWQDGPGQMEGYNRRPEYKPEDAARYGRRRVRSGNFAQKFFNTFSTHNAGLLQQVQVPVGSKLTLSAWVQAWSSREPNPDAIVNPGNYRVYIGIDPTGGTDWSSPNVVWSEPRMEYNTWMKLEVRAVAKASTITVFLRGQPEFRVQFNDSYWDDVCLTVVRPATPPPRPTNTPKATPTPTLTPTPTETPTPTFTPTPSPGQVCVSAFEDHNHNSRHDDGENLIAGSVISLFVSNYFELESYVTDGLSEPYCFTGLAEGTYFLKRQNPPGYVSTVPDDWAVVIVPGGRVVVELGAYFQPTPTATATATPTVTPTATPTPRPILKETVSATYRVSGIILAALALAIPVALHYLRRRL